MLKMAYAEADITPESGEDLCGFTLRKGPVTGVSDRLMTRWLSLSGANGGGVCLGSSDIISLSRSRFLSIRSAISEQIPKANRAIALATSHTHSGPATVPLRYCGRMNKAYMASLETKLVSTAVGSTKAKRRPVNVALGTSRSNWGVNRRDPDKGTVDPEVISLSFMDADTGDAAAHIVNYACHPVILGHCSNSVSADFPGALARCVQVETGAPCLFLNGACGDINPRNAHQIKREEVEKAGQAIGKKALAAMSQAKPLEVEDLQYFTRKVKLPVHVPKKPQELQDRLQMLKDKFGLDPKLFADRVNRDIRLLGEGRYPKYVTINLSLLTFGKEAAILFVPGELFSSIGLRAKRLMSPVKLLVAGFSNGSVGYLPDRQAYKDGGYEPYFANFFYDLPEFEPDLEDVLLEAIESLSRHVR